MNWHDIGEASGLKLTPGAPVRIGDRWIAVFRDRDEWLAIDNACPHAGAPLCDASVIDGKAVCYLHCWQFDLRTGACDVGKDWNVRTYPVREVDGRLQVGIATG